MIARTPTHLPEKGVRQEGSRMRVKRAGETWRGVREKGMGPKETRTPTYRRRDQGKGVRQEGGRMRVKRQLAT